MKVTRDKTQSVDLGNGLRLERNDGNIKMYFTSSTGCQCVYTDSHSFGTNEWANEIMDKHFTPITITLETEDEACTLWHYLNLTVPVIRNHLSETYKAPNKFDSLDMFTRLNEVYTPEKKK